MAANEWILPLLACLFDWIILLPIQFYNTIPLLSNSNIHQNRYPLMLKWINFIGIFSLSINHPLIVISQLSPINIVSPLIFKLITTITFCSSSILFNGICIFALSRYWLMFYDLNLLNSNINNQWKLLINPYLFNPSFWFNYKSTLGNQRFVLLSMVSVFLFICLLHCILMIMFSDSQYIPTWNVVKVSLFILPTILGWMLYFKSPHVINNKIRLKYELSSVLTIPMLMFMTIVPFNLYIIWLYDGYEQLNNHGNGEGIYNALTIIQVAPIEVLIFYAVTWWIPKRCNSDVKKQKYDGLDSNTSSNDKFNSNYSLYTILSDENLTREYIAKFCVDCNVAITACFIEMVQFKDLMQKTFDIATDRLNQRLSTIDEDQDEIKEKDDQLFIFSECDICSNKVIPKSHIVYNINKHKTIKDFLQIAHILYYKYIHQTEDAVKLSSTLRNCYEMDMNMPLNVYIDKEINQLDVKPNDLYEYFDLVIHEMWAYLDSDYNRLVTLTLSYGNFHGTN